MNLHFIDGARKVLAMAREEAIRLGHSHLGTEHILLGLIREGEGVAAAVLINLSVGLEQVRSLVEQFVPRGKATMSIGEIPYNRGAKKVLEFAMSEARDLQHSYVGTEHLLLGLLHEERGIAADVLARLGISLDGARQETMKLLGSSERRASHVDRSMEAAPDRVRVPLSDGERRQMLVEILRPIAVAASRLGGSPAELRAALEQAIRGVFDDRHVGP